MIRLSYWSGRTGNNIQQCAIGLLAAEALGNSFSQGLPHDIIDCFGYRFGNNNVDIVNPWFFIDGPNRPFVIDLDHVNANIRRVCKDLLHPYLKIKSRPPIDKDTLVIHIRSGDVMDQRQRVHSDYVPNPLVYYYHLMSQYNRTILVTEPDLNHPVIGTLMRNPNVSVQTSTVADDLGTLMAAKNLASSGVGTFCIAAALCSRNIENFYCTDLKKTEHLNYCMLLNTDVNVYVYKLHNYIKPGEWRNTQLQRDLIINFRNEMELYDEQ